MERIEDRIIEYIKEFFSSDYISDDCAVLGKWLLTKDVYISGTHFPENIDPFFAAWRSFAGALSDIAAMGGLPKYFLLGIGGKDKKQIKKALEGLLPLSKKFNTTLIGGDTVYSSILFLSFTIIGKAKMPLLRKKAKIGEFVYLTGNLGGARAGLEQFLESGEGTEKFLKPIPRIKEGIEISEHYSVGAMIDVSDGLIRDAERIAEASKVSIHINSDDIPVSPDAKTYCEKMGYDKITFSINSGEEYELLFTSPNNINLSYVKKIGTVKVGRGVFLDGKKIDSQGFEHFEEIDED